MSMHIEPIVTVDDLAAMPEDGNRYEVIGGEVFVSRAPTVTHQIVITRLIFSLQAHLDRDPIGVVITTPGVIFSPLDGVIPDLVYVSRERLTEILVDERLRGAPELIVEVVSPGTENERRDRVVKRQLYGKHGVREYWIIDPEKRSFEIYLLDGDVLRPAATLSGDNVVSTTLLPGCQASVEQLFAV